MDYDRLKMDLSQITLTQMRYAIAIAETGSFKAAAERCFVSQSGLSMQVMKLEELLGVRLFDRSKKPTLITSEGEGALAQMRVILRELERLGRIVEEEDEPSGIFRLGVIPSLAPTLIPLFLSDFMARYPRVELKIEELRTEEIIDHLLRDTLDAGLAAIPLLESGLREISLAHERLFAYLPPGDPLLEKKRIRQGELHDRPLWMLSEGHCFRNQVLSFCETVAAQSESDGVDFESGSFETIVRLVDRGMRATLLPAMVAHSLPEPRREAQLRRFVDPEPVREIGLVTAREDLRRGVTEALAASLIEAMKPILGGEPSRMKILEPR